MGWLFQLKIEKKPVTFNVLGSVNKTEFLMDTSKDETGPPRMNPLTDIVAYTNTLPAFIQGLRGIIEANFSRADEGPVAELAEAITQLPANVRVNAANVVSRALKALADGTATLADRSTAVYFCHIAEDILEPGHRLAQAVGQDRLHLYGRISKR